MNSSKLTHVLRQILRAPDMDALKAETETIRLMYEDKSYNLDIRPDSRSSERTLLNMSDTEMEEKRRSTDLEKEAAEGLLPKTITKDKVTEDPLARAKLMFWMVVNTVATVMIVSRLFIKTFSPNDPQNASSITRDDIIESKPPRGNC